VRRSVAVRAVAGLLALAAPLGAVIPASARPRLGNSARLQGQFRMTGRVTVARHVLGEHAGQLVSRTWTFTPLCPAGACRRIGLIRQRGTGTDHIVLHLTGVDRYKGHGRFYAPLRCGKRTVARGQAVPFTVRVRITATAVANGVPVARRLRASYVNRRRINRTRCVAPPAHDAAVYTGTLSP
jgi:hypothetical protein